MLISLPTIETTDDAVTVSARVKVDSCSTDFPETLWFRFPRRYADGVCDSGNAFAAALLPLAMYLGENMHVEGRVSPRLLNGMRDYVRLQTTWQPTPFQGMEITAATLETSRRPARSAVATTYSGGVDSIYTLQTRSGERQPNPYYRISHALMINGFDADSKLEDPQAFQAIADAQQVLMERARTDLVLCASNFKAFTDPVIFKNTFGAEVTAPALALGRLFSVLYIPSGTEFNDFLRDGSHTMMDHLLSSEGLEVIHDAVDVNRLQKASAITHWPQVQHALRVCFYRTGIDIETGAVTNCCRCEKCIRTMIALELAGALNRDSQPMACFPRPLTHWSIIGCAFDTRASRLFAREMFGQALRSGRWGIALDLLLAQVVTALLYLPRTLHRYAERRWQAYDSFMRRHFKLAPKSMRRIGKPT
jgi:hypothetical protein